MNRMLFVVLIVTLVSWSDMAGAALCSAGQTDYGALFHAGQSVPVRSCMAPSISVNGEGSAQYCWHYYTTVRETGTDVVGYYVAYNMETRSEEECYSPNTSEGSIATVSDPNANDNNASGSCQSYQVYDSSTNACRQDCSKLSSSGYSWDATAGKCVSSGSGASTTIGESSPSSVSAATAKTTDQYYSASTHFSYCDNVNVYTNSSYDAYYQLGSDGKPDGSSDSEACLPLTMHDCVSAIPGNGCGYYHCKYKLTWTETQTTAYVKNSDGTYAKDSGGAYIKENVTMRSSYKYIGTRTACGASASSSGSTGGSGETGSGGETGSSGDTGGTGGTDSGTGTGSTGGTETGTGTGTGTGTDTGTGSSTGTTGGTGVSSSDIVGDGAENDPCTADGMECSSSPTDWGLPDVNSLGLWERKYPEGLETHLATKLQELQSDSTVTQVFQAPTIGGGSGSWSWDIDLSQLGLGSHELSIDRLYIDFAKMVMLATSLFAAYRIVFG